MDVPIDKLLKDCSLVFEWQSPARCAAIALVASLFWVFIWARQKWGDIRPEKRQTSAPPTVAELFQMAGPVLCAMTVGLSLLGALHFSQVLRPFGRLPLIDATTKWPQPLGFLSQMPPEGHVADFGARALWASSAGLVIVGSIAVMWVVSGVWVSSSTNARRLAFGAALIFALAAAGVYITAAFSGEANVDHASTLPNILLCVTETRATLPFLTIGVDFLGVLGTSAAVLATMAGCMLAYPAHVGSDEEIAAQNLSRRWTLLGRVLFTSTVLLMAGILEVVALYSWTTAPYPSTADVKTRTEVCKNLAGPAGAATQCKDAVTDAARASVVDDAKHVVNSLALTMGSAFGLLLASIYLPAAFVLQDARANLFKTAKHEARTKALEEHGLDDSFAKQWGVVAAGLGPLLVGLVSAALNVKL